ncbi:YlbL family protein [Corynebacterium variabile]|uniref:YlbL family protein n=1 Tax=Corynebacterium variabile TaxID=1727 RepID=UPI001D9BF39B|nr:PDZ domain-containing protein [Corynebacterium variabile]HJG45856.1 PDZ domain-containing protein [Corynebacterium variabile]
MKFRSSSSGAQSGTPVTGGRRRVRTIAVGALPVVVMVALLGMTTVPGTDINLTVPFAAEGEGPTYNTLGDVDGTPVVDITGVDSDELDETSGNLNMTTVAVRTKMTLPQMMGRWLASDDTVVPLDTVIPANSNAEEVARQNAAAFASSESNATVAAMNHLGRPLETMVYDVSEGAPADGTVKINDVITSVDGTAVTVPGDVSEAIGDKSPGDEVTLGIDRGGKKETETVTLGEMPDELAGDEDAEAATGGNGKAFLGVTMVAQPADGIRVEYNLKDIGGPSAGLMFSLAVVDKLSPGELSGGEFVAGTGTIASDGTVGPIGGITHKISAAKNAGASVFLVPAGNCSEAASADSGDMTLLEVDTLDGAVDALTAHNKGEDVETCG